MVYIRGAYEEYVLNKERRAFGVPDPTTNQTKHRQPSYIKFLYENKIYDRCTFTSFTRSHSTRSYSLLRSEYSSGRYWLESGGDSHHTRQAATGFEPLARCVGQNTTPERKERMTRRRNGEDARGKQDGGAARHNREEEKKTLEKTRE